MKTKYLVGSLLVLGTLLVQNVQAQNNLTTTATERYFNVIRTSLEASAEQMPADKFSFRLTPGQMTFAQWMTHSAGSNYGPCATLRGQERPEAAAKVGDLTDKAAVSQAVKDSFAYCAEALKGLDDQKVLATPQLTNALLQTVVHNNEIYGNIVGYLRVSGIVPPSTARAQKGKKKK